MHVLPDLGLVADGPEGTSTVEPATPLIGKEPYLTPDAIVDTPIKRNSSTMLPFTTLARCRDQTLNTMGREMKGHFVGPMPVKEFLEEFLPTSEIPDYDTSSCSSTCPSGSFRNVISVKNEEHAYIPFVSISLHI
jgi:hypothetical protein